MILNANSIVQYVIQIKNGITKHVNVNVKIIVRAKAIMVGILAHVFVRIVIIITSVAECDETIIAINNLSAKKTKVKNVASTVSINCHTIKVKDFHILHTVLLAIIFLLIIIVLLISITNMYTTKKQNKK